jgi:hypothetical protein
VLRKICASLSLEEMAKELVMVMGVGRSGTTALFRSLAKDRRVVRYNESIDSAIYFNYRLRPLGEIASVLSSVTGPVLLKPVHETSYRTIEDVIDEFRGYALRIVWIYRDPVNVFYSMHLQGWVPFTKIGSDSNVEQWSRRNRLAHESYERHPDFIAIVRYEDLLIDSRVFRRLCKWLGIQGKSCFRADSGKGRRQVPLAVQSKIDSRTTEVLRALDAARIFRPRITQRLRHPFVQKLSAGRKMIYNAVCRSHSDRERHEWSDLLAAGARCTPSQIAELRFWLDCGKNLQRTGKLRAELRENGPSHMSATSPVNSPYYVSSCINGQPALFFPADKVKGRRESPHGILEFGVGADWPFMFDGSPFAVFAVFKPSVPAAAFRLHQRALLIRAGAVDRVGPAFILQWNSDLNASEGIMTDESAGGDTKMEQQVALTARASHPHEQWRIVNFQYTREGTLLSFANGAPGTPCQGKDQQSRPKNSFYSTLQLGGADGEIESLFFGAVAEVIIFSDSLDDQQRTGITRYLKEKYRL